MNFCFFSHAKQHFLAYAIIGLIVPSLARAEDDSTTARWSLMTREGHRIPGALLDSDQVDVVRWQAPGFPTPFEFSTPLIAGIEIATLPPRQSPRGNMGCELSGGDVLFGDLLQLSEQELEIDVHGIGSVHIDRAQLVRLLPQHDAGNLVYLGPNGLADCIASEDSWDEMGGQLVATRPEAVLYHNIDMPERARIELDLSWDTDPDFAISLGVGAIAVYAKKAIRLETWKNDLVLLRELDDKADVERVTTIAAGPGRLRMTVYLDRTTGYALAVSESRDRVAEIRMPYDSQGTGVRLEVKEPGLRLERLQVARWNGQPPLAQDQDRPRVVLSDNTTEYGELVAYDMTSGAFTFRTGGETRDLAARGIDSIVTHSESAPVEGTVRVLRSDGLRVTGRLQRIDPAHLTVSRLGIREPLTISLPELVSFSCPSAPGSPDLTDGPTSGRLEYGTVAMVGSLTSVEGTEEDRHLAWRPGGSLNSSLFTPDFAGRIVYHDAPAVPVPPPRPARENNRGVLDGFLRALVGKSRVPQEPHIIYLRTGDSFPCRIASISEDGAHFSSGSSETTFIPHADLQAVVLHTETARAVPPKEKRDRLLTVPRMQRDSPPTHLIQSRNGDFLRTRLVSMTDDYLTTEVRLTPKKIPTERVSVIIWLHPTPDQQHDNDSAIDSNHNSDKDIASDSGSGSDNIDHPQVEQIGGQVTGTDIFSADRDAQNVDAVTEHGAPFSPYRGLVQAIYRDGIRLTFRPQSLQDNILSGSSAVLGSCHIDLSAIDQLLLGDAIGLSTRRMVYHRWRLRDAIEPRYVTAEEGEGSAGTESTLVGKLAPEIDLMTLDGERYRLTAQRGKVVVLDFWATWCGPCVQWMPEAEKIVREFADREVELVAVNLEEDQETIRSLLERTGVQPLVLLDRDGATAAAYEARAIPQTVIIGRDGHVVRLFVGGGSQVGQQLRMALEAVVSGQ